jgi:outer membrane receptor protein involved in Fe transport
MKKYFLCILLIFFCTKVFGQGKIQGIIINKTDRTPIGYVHIEVRTVDDNQLVAGTLTDTTGGFGFDKLPYREYVLICSLLGFEKTDGIRFTVSRDKPVVNLGLLEMEESTQELDEVVVSGQKSTYVSKIDRKVFYVGQDLMSALGSASDLMQNIPSVQVDVEGNVSLRGSENVQILINGRTSNLVKGASRAATLQQIPANTIERIEVITNPSARYKPDGTSGIINIVLKKEKRAGINGDWAANAGNNNRYNSTLALNYNPGKINFFGSYGIRFDDRSRYSYDNRTRMTTETGALTYIDQNTDSKARPISQIARGGINWDITPKNNIEVASAYTLMTFRRDETIKNNYFDQNHHLFNDYTRFRDDDEYQKGAEIEAAYTHIFDEDHEFTLDYTLSWEDEQEDNKYINRYYSPVRPEERDNTLIRQKGGENLIRGNYCRPIGEDGKLDAGFEFEIDRADMDFRGEFFENNAWTNDVEKTNRFVFEENIYALYATYESEFGKIGVMGGVRGEYSDIMMRQKTTGTVTPNRYSDFYPTLHTAYHFNDRHEMQLNYSMRVNRPEGDDLNPFPEWRDPLSVSTGNPLLKPEKIHSVEMGYMFRDDIHTLVATAYHRSIFNRMTEVTEYGYGGNAEILWTRKENLSSSQSSGMEFIINSGIGKAVRFNLSSNVFYNIIDASSLGFSSKKSTVAWNAALNANFNMARNLLAQLNTRYTAKSLTPQGYRQPSFIMNFGTKYDILKNKASLMFTVSDFFNSFRQINIIDRPELLAQVGNLDNKEVLIKQRIERKRPSQIFYIGFVFHFGKTLKNTKEPELKYDEGI